MNRVDLDIDDAAEIEAFDSAVENALATGDLEEFERLLAKAEAHIGGSVDGLEFDGF